MNYSIGEHDQVSDFIYNKYYNQFKGSLQKKAKKFGKFPNFLDHPRPPYSLEIPQIFVFFRSAKNT